MARRRGQRKGNLVKKGPSWMLRWWEDVRDADGALARRRFSKVIAPAKGPAALTRREAERLPWDEVLGKLDRVSVRPSSLATIAEFVEGKFEPEWIWSLKPGGQKHYRHILNRHVLPEIGNLRLREVMVEDIQALIRGKADSLSVQSLVHIKNAVSVVFRHAKACGFYVGENPAHNVRMPRMQRRRLHALSPGQARSVLAMLGTPIREAALLAMTTSLNVAEIFGLRWRRVNLSDSVIIVDGEAIMPFSIAVRENYYDRQFTSLKSGSRRRDVPVPEVLVGALAAIKVQARFSSPDDPVFASSRGTPLDANNVRTRVFKKIRSELGLPELGWHTFRRTAATLAEVSDMVLSDRIAMLGHARADMTMHYTISDLERRRGTVNKIAEDLTDHRSPSIN